jgi:DNA-binding NtrC family response regulator
MSAAKMKPIKILSGDQELVRIESEQIMRVLMIEDNDSVRESTVRRLQESGYSVDAFPTPREAAQHLQPNAFQLVIADIRFEAPNISGDEFVYKNKDVLDDARIVAFTGHEDDIVHNEVFDEVILKGRANNALYEYAENVYHERQKVLAKRIEAELIDSSMAKHSELSQDPKEELLRILNETKDKDKKILWYKGRDFSASELIREVEDDTSTIGKSHIRMAVDWLTRKNRG